MSNGTSFFDQAPSPPPPPEDLGGMDDLAEPEAPKGGAPIHDPRELSKRANRRKGLVIGVLGSVGIIAIIVMLLSGGDDPAPAQTAASGRAIADTGDMTVGRGGNTGLGIDTTSLDNVRAGGVDGRRGEFDIPDDLSATLGGGANLGPAPSLEGVSRSNQNPAPNPIPAELATGPDLGVETAPLPQPQAPPSNAPLDLTGGGLLGQFTTNSAASENTTPNEATDEDAALRAQARADSIRAAVEARQAERLAKLRAQGITILSGAPAPDADRNPFGGTTEAAASRAGDASERVFVPMDASAPAIMVTEFNSGLTGNNVIAQLTAPLRVRGQTLLPAGTRAQGTASARIGSRGTRTEVTMTFRTFVLPNGERVQGFQAEVGDPRSMSRGLTNVGVNRHYPPQILGAAAASAFELLVGSLSRNRASTFEQPSVFDESVARVRDRGTSIFAGEFQEGRWEPTVRVERGARVVLLFGLTEREVQPMDAATVGNPGGLP